jgi:hypothetical protein
MWIDNYKQTYTYEQSVIYQNVRLKTLGAEQYTVHRSRFDPRKEC